MQCVLCNSSSTAFKYKKDSYQYYLCEYCNSLFIGNPLTENSLNKYYETSFEYSYGIETKKTIASEAKLSLQKILDINKKGKRLLDIGVGNGEFIEEAMKIGLLCKGVEPSKDLYARLNNDTQNIVLNINARDFLKNDTSRYDFISLIHVVEHLIHPQELIKDLWTRLNKGGVLFIETPNIRSWLYIIENQNYTFLTPPDHTCLFSPKSFGFISNNLTELRELKIETYSYESHIIGTLRKLIHFRDQKKHYADNSIDPISTPRKTSARLNLGIYLSVVLRQLYNFNHRGSILKGYFIRT